MSNAELTAEADVEAVEGIGSSYAEQLREAGIETVADLANADQDALADEVDVGSDRLGEWIERANQADGTDEESTDEDDADEGGDGTAAGVADEQSGPLAVRRAVETTAEQLIGRPLDGVVEVEPRDEGWRAVVEVIERASVPSTQDILGLYEITLDEDGQIQGYRRTRRYRRSDTSPFE